MTARDGNATFIYSPRAARSFYWFLRRCVPEERRRAFAPPDPYAHFQLAARRRCRGLSCLLDVLRSRHQERGVDDPVSDGVVWLHLDVAVVTAVFRRALYPQ